MQPADFTLYIYTLYRTLGVQPADFTLHTYTLDRTLGVQRADELLLGAIVVEDHTLVCIAQLDQQRGGVRGIKAEAEGKVPLRVERGGLR